jgi:hypothetical protein
MLYVHFLICFYKPCALLCVHIYVYGYQIMITFDI